LTTQAQVIKTRLPNPPPPTDVLLAVADARAVRLLAG
jgi:hypothetical protein